MDLNTSAKLAEMTYEIGNTKGKEQRNNTINDVNKHLEDEGVNYSIVPEHTNKNITTYVDKNNPKNIHISHKGTQIGSSTAGKDVVADLMLAFGLGNYNSHIRRRRKLTDKAIKKLDPDTLTMSSHSLGGFSQNHTIAKSKKVRDKLLQADTFNAGSSPIFNNDLKLSKQAKKELKSIPITHHRTRNDVVSKGLTLNVPFGELKEYKLRPTKYEKEHENNYTKSLKDKDELNKLSFGSKAFYAHHLHHFSQRILDPIKKHINRRSRNVKGKNIYSS